MRDRKKIHEEQPSRYKGSFRCHRCGVGRDGRLGGEGVALKGHTLEAEKIVVRYAESMPAPENMAPIGILGGIDPEETYWRSTQPHRQLLKLKAKNYSMTLIEELRSKRWEEDFYPRLKYVTRYPCRLLVPR